MIAANTSTISMVSSAEQERTCIRPVTNAQKQYLKKRVKNGTFLRTFRNLYSQTEYWQKLYTSERIRHVVLSLMDIYPDWKFTVTSGAALLGYDVVEDYDALFVVANMIHIIPIYKHFQRRFIFDQKLTNLRTIIRNCIVFEQPEVSRMLLATTCALCRRVASMMVSLLHFRIQATG